MDNTTNNNSNFAPSISNNDINAAALTGQNQPNSAYPAAPLQAVTPVPTWLPPQPDSQDSTLSQNPPAPTVAVEAAPLPASAPPAAISSSWPSTPQDHGGASVSWTPPPVGQNIPGPPLPSETPVAIPPAAEMVAPASSTPWTHLADQNTPTSAVLPQSEPVAAAQPVPTWPAPPEPVQTEPLASPSTQKPTIPAPIPTPEAVTANPTSAWPTPPGTPAAGPVPEPNLVPLAKAPVFPPQFSNQGIAPPPGNNVAAQPVPTWPAPPEPVQTEPVVSAADNSNPFTNFSTPQPPSNQVAGGSTFVPQMENLTPSIPPPFAQASPQTGTFGSSPLPAAAPTVPDFLAGFNNQNPNPATTEFSLSSRESPQTPSPSPSPDTSLTDLSSMGNPPNGQVYNPAVTIPEVGVMPSGIPEAVAHSNRPRLSKSIIIGAAVATLLIIGSASYLLFFSPKPGTPEDTISLPVQAPLTKPKLINTPVPVGAATESATPAGESTTSGSAFDLLKKQTASPSPAAQ